MPTVIITYIGGTLEPAWAINLNEVDHYYAYLFICSEKVMAVQFLKALCAANTAGDLVTWQKDLAHYFELSMGFR